MLMEIPVVVRSKTRVCNQSLAGIAGSNPTGGLDVLCGCVLSGLCVSPSLVQRSPTECGVSKCDSKQALTH